MEPLTIVNLEDYDAEYQRLYQLAERYMLPITAKEDIASEITGIISESPFSTFYIWTVVEILDDFCEGISDIELSVKLVSGFYIELRNFVIDVHKNNVSEEVEESFWYIIVMSIGASCLPDTMLLLDLLRDRSIEGYITALGALYQHKHSHLAEEKLKRLADNPEEAQYLHRYALEMLE